MAMRNLVSKLRIRAAASRRTPPTFCSFSTASKDKLGSTGACGTAKEVYPHDDHKATLELTIARYKRYGRCLTCLRLIANVVIVNILIRLSDQKKPDQKPE